MAGIYCAEQQLGRQPPLVKQMSEEWMDRYRHLSQAMSAAGMGRKRRGRRGTTHISSEEELDEDRICWAYYYMLCLVWDLNWITATFSPAYLTITAVINVLVCTCCLVTCQSAFAEFSIPPVCEVLLTESCLPQLRVIHTSFLLNIRKFSKKKKFIIVLWIEQGGCQKKTTLPCTLYRLEPFHY